VAQERGGLADRLGIGTCTTQWLRSKWRCPRPQLFPHHPEIRRNCPASCNLFQSSRAGSREMELHLVRGPLCTRRPHPLRCPRDFKGLPQSCTLRAWRLCCNPQLLQWHEDGRQLGCQTSPRDQESQECYLVHW
jgi:hypothetical protein